MVGVVSETAVEIGEAIFLDREAALPRRLWDDALQTADTAQGIIRGCPEEMPHLLAHKRHVGVLWVKHAASSPGCTWECAQTGRLKRTCHALQQSLEWVGLK